MIRVHSITPDAVLVATQDVYGGVEINIGMHNNVMDILSWVQKYRAQLEWEQQQRAADPELQHLYDQYQTYLKLKQP